mgnify:CR=1 FL=1
MTVDSKDSSNHDYYYEMEEKHGYYNFENYEKSGYLTDATVLYGSARN